MNLAKTEEAFRAQVRRCEKLLKQHQHEELLTKSLASAKKALSALQDVSGPEAETATSQSGVKTSTSQGGVKTSMSQSGVKTALQWFSQSVLDSTYHRESQLVHQSFPPSLALETIYSIIGCLSLPSTLCGSLEKTNSLLDVEILECLHWRVGALLYMYCHTLMSDKQRVEETKTQEFLECCCAGAGYLRLMLTTRTPLGTDEDYVAHDAGVPELLKKGIFSNVHMLALMYAGELCYWRWELDGGGTAGSSDGSLSTADQAEATTPHREKENSNSDLPEASRVSPLPSGLEIPSSGLEELSISEATPRSCASPTTAVDSLYLLMKHLRGDEFVQRWHLEFDAVVLAQGFLSKYLETARGPLKGQGWSYDRAVQLLVKLKKAAKPSICT